MPEPVPTVVELAHRGLAHLDTRVPKGGVARYRVTDEGHRLMGEAMRRNAQESLQEEVPDVPAE